MIEADASFAAPPPVGINCVAADGKINGRGATFQTTAQKAFWDGYSADVCGPVASDADAGTNMGVYNYLAAANPSITTGVGSGNGIKAMRCRTDAYAGSDKPYSEADLLNASTGMNGALPAAGVTPCNIPFSPPFQPTGPPLTSWPDATDKVGKVMSFPVAGTAVALMVNLTTAGDCGGDPLPTGLDFSPAQVAFIMRGDATAWNDPVLVAGNPQLTNCTKPITRVVRQDDSGTTAIFKRYLQRIDPTRGSQTGPCFPSPPAVSTLWSSTLGGADNLNNSSPNPPGNARWPGDSTHVGGVCSPVLAGAGDGAGVLITTLNGTDGGIGYADLPDAQTAAPGIFRPTITSGDGVAQTPPSAGAAANCSFATALTLPGSTSSDSVGLKPTDNWASDNSTVNAGALDHVNATNIGGGYPICGLTFDLVWTKLNVSGPASPIGPRFTANQRRNLYSFDQYIVSPLGQSKLGLKGYAALPGIWLNKLSQGIQLNY